MGVTMTFANGKRLNWKNEPGRVGQLDPHAFWDTKYYAYSFVELTEEEAKQFGKSWIKSYRLFTHELKMPKKLAKELKMQAKCLLMSTPDTTRRKQ